MTVRVGDPELVLDPYDYDFHEDPYPYYRRLRDEAPLYRNEERNFWAVSRHHDVLQGFRDSTALSNAYGVSLDPSSRTSEAYRVMSMLAMDDPAHLRMRTLVSKGFTPRRIRELEPQVLELARIHLDSALQTESFDFVAEFAGKLPMDVISELIGVPDTDRARIRALADAVLHREDGVADVPPPAMAASIELMRYYADLIAEFRRRPANNLTSALLAAELDGDRLSDQEIMAFLFLMVIAGNETTTKLLANAVYWAAHHPGQLARVFADHSRIPMWVEETLRYDTSSQILARTVAHDLTLYDTTIPEGEVLLLLPGSANRDDRVFDDPDDYRIGREIGCKLVSFGSGAHFVWGLTWPGWKPGWPWARCCVGSATTKSTTTTSCASIPATCADLPICRSACRPGNATLRTSPRPADHRRRRRIVGHRRGHRNRTRRPRVSGRLGGPPHGQVGRAGRQNPRRRWRGGSLPLDVTDPESVKSFVAQTVEALGEVELLVSSAGDMLPGQLHEVSTEAFAEQVQIHLVGANRLATAVLPAMVARRRGDLIFVGSDVGLRQRPHMGAYGAAKAGLAAMVTNLQMELEGTGVRASIVHPGPTLTGMGWQLSAEQVGPMLADWAKWGQARHNYFLRPSDLARAIAFVAETPRGCVVVNMEIQPEALLRDAPAHRQKLVLGEEGMPG